MTKIESWNWKVETDIRVKSILKEGIFFSGFCWKKFKKIEIN